MLKLSLCVPCFYTLFNFLSFVVLETTNSLMEVAGVGIEVNDDNNVSEHDRGYS